MLKNSICLFAVLLALSNAGCGLSTPQIAEVYDKGVPADPGGPGIPERRALSSTSVLEYAIQKAIFCELRAAAKAAREFPYETGPTHENQKPDKDALLPKDWLIEESLLLEVDESTALNPGVVLNTPLPNGVTGFGSPNIGTSLFQQSFGLGLGGTLSATATRIDKFDSFFPVSYLSKDPSKQSFCQSGRQANLVLASGQQAISSPFVVQSDLGITDWLVGSRVVSRGIHSVGTDSQVVGSPSGFHPDVITIEIKFIIVSNGNINPSWKLVRVSSNTGTSPLLSVGRTRTHDVIITVGPPKADLNNTHFASQIGSAVASANRTTLIQTQ